MAHSTRIQKSNQNKPRVSSFILAEVMKWEGNDMNPKGRSPSELVSEALPSLSSKDVDSVFSTLIAMSKLMHQAIMAQISKRYAIKSKKEVSNEAMADALNSSLHFSMHSEQWKRFLGTTKHKGYAVLRKYLLESGIVFETPNKRGGYSVNFRYNRKIFTAENVESKEEVLQTLGDEFLQCDWELIPCLDTYYKKLNLRLSSLLGRMKNIRLLEEVPKDTPIHIVNQIYDKYGGADGYKKFAIDFNNRVKDNTFKAYTLFSVGRFYSEFASLPKIIRPLLWDSFLGEGMVEVDYHALHPMILKGELRQFVNETTQWAEKERFDWDKFGNVKPCDLLSSLSGYQEHTYGHNHEKPYEFLRLHPNLLECILAKYSLNKMSKKDILKNYQSEFERVFNYEKGGDFYNELVLKLGLDKILEEDRHRKAIKVCVLQLLHGQQWRGDSRTPLANNTSLNDAKEINQSTRDLESLEHIEDEKKRLDFDEKEWNLFYPIFCEKFPLLALGMSYLQFCVSLKNRFHTKGWKMMGFSRFLFAKEVELIKFTTKALMANTNASDNEKYRIYFQAIGYEDDNKQPYDGGEISIFPIYDCVSITASKAKFAKDIMELVAKHRGYEIDAEIESGLFKVSSQNIPIGQKEMKLNNIHSLKLNNEEHYHSKILNAFKDAKKHFSIRRNGKNKTINIKSCHSEDEVTMKFRREWDNLRLTNYRLVG